MDSPIQLETRVTGRNVNEELIFRSTTAPEALVEVTIGNETVIVSPTALRMAVAGVTEEEA